MTSPAAPPLPHLSVATAYGRLYIKGRDAGFMASVPGVAYNQTRDSYEASLTLETLRAMRQRMRVDRSTFARLLTPDVLHWAKAAGEAEAKLLALHEKVATGWRVDLPWTDSTGRHRPPFKHQEVMATVAISLDGCAFLCEMGTGKTRAAIESINYLMRNDLDVVVVICPRGVIGTWDREVKMWAPDLRVRPLIGKVKNREQEIRDLTDDFSRTVIVVNYDVLSDLQSALTRLCDRRRVGFVFDEMHRLKNPQTQAAKAAMTLVKEATWRLGMTGTPILNGVEDVWSQWYLVDLGVTFGANWTQFKREFFDYNPYTFSLTPRERTLEEVGLRLQKRGLRFRKADCLDLPPKLYETVRVEMTPEQKRAYNQMAEELVTRLEGGPMPSDGDDPTVPDKYASAATQLVAILRLTQITSGHVTTEDGELFLFRPNPKLRAAVELVRENVRDRKVIIWAWYKNDVAMLARELADLSPVKIIGGQTQRERDDAERRFQNDETCRVLIANPGAGGVGLNLQAASLAIYYSQGYSLGDRLQSEDRCHRAGSEQHSKVTYIDLVCEGTIDEVIVEALQGKKEVAEMVVDLRRHIGL